jgi:hypothetical protein
VLGAQRRVVPAAAGCRALKQQFPSCCTNGLELEGQQKSLLAGTGSGAVTHPVAPCSVGGGGDASCLWAHLPLLAVLAGAGAAHAVRAKLGAQAVDGLEDALVPLLLESGYIQGGRRAGRQRGTQAGE